MNIETTRTNLSFLLIWIQILKIRLILKRKRRRVTRRWWVKPHLTTDVRQKVGAHRKLFAYFRSTDHEEFYNLTRMTVQQFDHLYDLLKPLLKKRSRREPLPTEIRLAVTLNFLAHGDSTSTIALLYRIGRSTLYKIIPEVCDAIWKILQPTYLQYPLEENGWIKISEEFNNIWNFPNCVGAIDGKHCRIQAPKSGSVFHNYKNYFSLVLMAIADARYRFIWVDIGDYGSLNDAGIWSDTTMKKAFEEKTISIPQARPLLNTNCLLPFCLVGDEGFPLKTYLMRPFAERNVQNNDQRIFNYRLSRARRVVENAFGILVSRAWQILHKPLALKLNTVEKIVQAVTCLHNYIITTQQTINIYEKEV